MHGHVARSCQSLIVPHGVTRAAGQQHHCAHYEAQQYVDDADNHEHSGRRGAKRLNGLLMCMCVRGCGDGAHTDVINYSAYLPVT